MRFDAVVVLGKELRRDPARGMAELRARAAAAAAAHRAGVPVVVALEAHLRGQDEAGSVLVADALRAFGVPESAMVLETVTHSTREEAVVAHDLAERHGWRRLLVVTAAYHLPRARRCMEDVHGSHAVAVHTPEAILQAAAPDERTAILGAIPSQDTLQVESRAETTLQGLASLLWPLPDSLRWYLEIQAGRALRARR